MTRAILVANPNAGSVSPSEDPAWVRARLAGLGWTVLPTPETLPADPDLEWLAAFEAADVVVAMGGDGTVRRLLPYLMAHPTPLAILPCGTGNDLARSIGLPLDADQALNVASQGRQRWIEVAMVNGHAFINVASLGLSAEISLTVQASTKRWLGPLAYRLAVMRAVWQRPTLTLSLVANGKRRRLTAYQVSIANGVSFGGGWRIADGAQLDDQTMDIVVIGPMAWRERWQRLWQSERGGLAGSWPARLSRHPRAGSRHGDRRP
jgi:diacylglycerol kinase (ATP)